MIRSILFARVAILAGGIVAGTAFGQPAPKLNSISPEWIQRGTTLDVTFVGENLAGVTNFLFAGDSGLSATNIPRPEPPKPAVTIESVGGGITRVEARPPRRKRLVVRVTASADASLTAREVRVVSPAGASNPLLLNAGQYPEAGESGGNNTRETAQALSLPVVVSGVVGGAAEVDYYRFKAEKGQQLVFEVDASRRGSALDSSLAVLDAEGKELGRSEDARGLDSLLIFTAPADGEYVLQLRDFRYQGGGNYAYRLTGGALPYVEQVFPFGGQRGRQVEVALSGRNLAGTAKMTFDLVATGRVGRQELRARTPVGYSNPFLFDVSEFPDFNETEPNNALDKANVITPPVVVNGRMNEAGDVDRFKFTSAKDQKLICEVRASRFGSKLDALLMLSDAKGGLLAQNDDAAAAQDARLEFDAKKDTEYVLTLRDLTDRGGESFGFRLSIGPPSAAESGFTAVLLPDTLRVYRGGRTRLRCEATRQAGFDGSVRFVFADLPVGVSDEPLTLTTAPSSGLMILSALKDAPVGTFPVRLVANGQVGGKPLTRPVQPLSGDKPARQTLLTVLEAAPFDVELITLTAVAEQNQSATVEVAVNRREGFTGDVKLAVEGFSAGREPVTKNFDVSEVTVKGTDQIGRLNLRAKIDAEVGTRTIIVRGDATVEGQPVSQFSRLLPVTVVQFPFVISSTLGKLTVTALPTNAASAASETATAIKLQRRDGFTGELALTLEGLPAGVIATLPNIPPNGAEATLRIVATEKAPMGTNISFSVKGSGVFNDRTYRAQSGKITLAIAAPEATETNVTATASTNAAGTK